MDTARVRAKASLRNRAMNRAISGPRSPRFLRPAAHVLVGAALLLGCVGAREARRGGAKPLSDQPLITDFSGPASPRFAGRFEQQKDGPLLAWSGSSVTVRFEGTGLSADLRESGENRYVVLVDGELRSDKIVPGPGTPT